MSTSHSSPQQILDSPLSSVRCPKCDSEHQLEGGSTTQSLVCPKCRTLLHLKDGRIEIPQSGRGRTKPSQPIEVGMEGRFKGKNYKVVGWVRYKGESDGERWQWDEWQLNSQKGQLRWLSFSKDEGFLFSKETRSKKPFDAATAERILVRSGSFNIIERYPAQVIGLAGELDWHAQIGDIMHVAEGRRGRNRLTVEVEADESIKIYEGHPISTENVWTALGRTDLAQKELVKDDMSLMSPDMVAGVGTLLLSILCSFIFIFSGTEIHSSTVALRTGPENYKSTEPFTIPSFGRASQIEISIDSLPVNNWAVVDVSLYDDEDGEYYLFSEEFWDEEGYDDGYWRENDYSGSYLFKAPYAGEYEIELLMEEATVDELVVNVAVFHNIWLVRYFIIAAIVGLGLWVLLDILLLQS